MTLQGIGASDGIGLGTVLPVRPASLDYSAVVSGGPETERGRLTAAIQRFTETTTAMAESLRADVGEKESEILTGQVVMLSDPFMQSQMTDCIDGGQCAEAAVDQVCSSFMAMFAGVDDEMMRQRATDIGDIRSRMLSILLGREATDLSRLPDNTVLVVHDLTPSMTVGMDRQHVAAIVTEVGGRTSHSAILARAMEVPAVLSVANVVDTLTEGQEIIVDGTAGVVLTEFDEATRQQYEAKRAEYLHQRELLNVYRDRPTVDADGNHYGLYANIGSAAEAQAAADAGAEGIGLFRTEFLFMDRTAAPTEEEQYEAYAAVAKTMAGKEVIIRTLDVGGDKAVDYLEMEPEENPFLGHRAIRYCLDRADLFRVQLRALLRAGAVGKNIKIMLPLVTSVEEIRKAKALLEDCKAELQAEGKAFDAEISVGIMIETPAAAWIADLLALECDFFSIGTNDLTQYTMAVDRGNAKVAGLYDTLHPAVLRSIRSVIAAAKAAKIPVGMCGEAAADPRLTPLLLTWGLDEFSVSASSVLATRAQIHGWHRKDAAETAERAMNCATAAAVAERLSQ